MRNRAPNDTQQFNLLPVLSSEHPNYFFPMKDEDLFWNNSLLTSLINLSIELLELIA